MHHAENKTISEAVSFTPNTITYTPKDKKEEDRIIMREMENKAILIYDKQTVSRGTIND